MRLLGGTAGCAPRLPWDDRMGERHMPRPPSGPRPLFSSKGIYAGGLGARHLRALQEEVRMIRFV